jgi:hypothetical protein
MVGRKADSFEMNTAARTQHRSGIGIVEQAFRPGRQQSLFRSGEAFRSALSEEGKNT